MPAVNILAVNHIGVSVSDMQRAIVFFRDVLGASVTEPVVVDYTNLEKVNGVPKSKLNACFATLHGVSFELLEYYAPEGMPVSDHHPGNAGHLHIGLTVNNIEEVAAKMDAAGFRPVGPVQWGLSNLDIAAVYTYGFDNLVVELLQFDAPGTHAALRPAAE